MIVAGPCADRAAFVLPAFDPRVLLLRREAIILLVERAHDLPVPQFQLRDYISVAGCLGYLDCALDIETRVVPAELGDLTLGITHAHMRDLGAPREIGNVSADIVSADIYHSFPLETN
jgi:hypothetical protein